MAGGIDWFRWHHGSVTDPKFALVARKARARLGDVIAVWAFILEAASAEADRGTVGPVDCEALDCMLGADDGTTARIVEAMGERGLIAGNRIASWDKRQPKREDETAAERKRRQREREHEERIAAANAAADAVTGSASRGVTQGHADVTHGHDRGEERREEENPRGSKHALGDPPARTEPTPAARACIALRQAGLSSVNPSDPRLTALLDRGATVEFLVGLVPTARDKRNGWAYLLGAAEGQLQDAAAIASQPRGAPRPGKQEALEQRNRQVAHAWAGGKAHAAA